MSTPKVEVEQHGELNCWRITSAHAELLVAQQGAQVLSYQRVGEPPLLWLSDKAIFKQGKSVRAGVPVCWPWFGVFKRNPASVQAMYAADDGAAHGLVRGRDWQLLGIESQGDSVRVELTLPQTRGELPGWAHDVELTLEIVMDEQLRVRLISHNHGTAPVTISQALHSYFAVSDVREVQVEGVEGLGFIDTLADWQQRTQHGALDFAGETDRIYLNAPNQLSIVDPAWKRRIVLTSEGSRTAVLWNPWTERAAELPDMAPEGWQRMLCIETANVWDDLVELAPGASHTLGVRMGSVGL
ncbi:D-hexose-6-phosphate mutarotase [Pseudomonas fontis]|uniref:Putative glucose-6-phosphate 1-epimerase n=1 Tax=Pseudomonas fontis TaxID=2942633 RepID=A0ABT5NUE1_9PSED|nr:D-hexose-6-phosphate mutarotase [Pseudomonas fontis]MDD0976306.1 D-hexose-6-phosphate mutarotase [Pseudomonas fontis]MDD0991793.1 D-hexose-6-phosphate mutarotase [Pseudomonas fontis]